MESVRTRGARALVLALGLVLAVASLGSLPSAVGAEGGMVNVNTASAAELQTLPGIGEAKARAIVEERQRRGGFERVEDLLEVRGIGEVALEKLRPHVTVKGKTTAQAP